MNGFEKNIASALSADEQQLIEDMPDYDSIFTLMSRSFRSSMRPFVVLLMVMTTLMTGFCAFSIWKVFDAETTQHQILWALASMQSFIWVGLAKVWYLLQIERQNLLMELKRAELRILTVIESKGT